MSQMPTADDLIQPAQAPAANDQPDYNQGYMDGYYQATVDKTTPAPAAASESHSDDPEPDADAHLLNLLVKRHGARNIVVALDSLTYGAGAMGYAPAPELPNPPVMIDNAAHRIVVNNGIPMTMEQGDALRALATTELHYVWQRAIRTAFAMARHRNRTNPNPFVRSMRRTPARRGQSIHHPFRFAS